jgi:hypothetical protein
VPIQARLWLEWDTTPLDNLFLSTRRRESTRRTYNLNVSRTRLSRPLFLFRFSHRIVILSGCDFIDFSREVVELNEFVIPSVAELQCAPAPSQRLPFR